MVVRMTGGNGMTYVYVSCSTKPIMVVCTMYPNRQITKVAMRLLGKQAMMYTNK